MINGYGLYDVIGNVAEYTLTAYLTGYGIETYPQEEALLSDRNMPMYGDNGAVITRGGSAWNAIGIFSRKEQVKNSYLYDYVGGWTSADAPRVGFRVCRRHDVVRPVAICEIRENFETWASKTSYGTATQTTSAGNWKLESWIFVREDSDNTYSGINYLYFDGGELYFPPLVSRLVEVRCKVRNPTASSHDVSLYCGNSTDGYTSRGVSIPAYSDYQTIVLSPSQAASSYFISANGLYIDDLEIWTIPRTIE